MADSIFSDHTLLIPGPPFRIELPAIDALFPVHYTRRLLIFRCASPRQRNEQLSALKIGLQRLASRYPILAGVVGPPSDKTAPNGQDNWLTIVPGPGIELVVRDLRTKMSSFQELEKGNFQAGKLPYDLLTPVPRNVSGDRPFAACMVQFSAIDGGTIITVAISHSVADGSGKNELTRVLAEQTRLAQLEICRGLANGVHSNGVDASVDMDRSVLRNISSDLPFNIHDHPGYVRKTAQSNGDAVHEQALPHPFQATASEIPLIYRFSTTSLAKLKADATQPSSPPISTHDALTALMWRSVLLIRSRRSDSAHSLVPSTEGHIFMPSDVRNHLKLPASYIGNVVYQLTAKLELETLFSPSGLQQAASAIRRAIKAATPTLVSSYMAKVNESWVDWAFLSKYSNTGMAMATDWKGAPMYEQDWGKAFGPLLRYRYPDEPINCVYPKLPNGEAEIQVSVMPDEVEMLKSVQCLGKYIET